MLKVASQNTEADEFEDNMKEARARYQIGKAIRIRDVQRGAVDEGCDRRDGGGGYGHRGSADEDDDDDDHQLNQSISEEMEELGDGGDQSNVSYELRENPKKSWRISDPNSLLWGYVKCGATDLAMAQSVFDEMPDKDVVSWTSMVSGYARSNPRELQVIGEAQMTMRCMN